MLESSDRHRIPADLISSGQVSRWNVPWILDDVRLLDPPVSYQHKSGAVTWVNLAPRTSAEIVAQLQSRGEATQAVSDPADDPNSGAGPDGGDVDGDVRPVVGLMTDGLVLGWTQLTAGNIRNNRIYLRQFIDRFPADSVGGSNRQHRAARTVQVDWGGETPVETDIDGDKKFFRSRSWVREFLAHNGAAEGDRVIVECTGPYRYRLRLRKTR